MKNRNGPLLALALGALAGLPSLSLVQGDQVTRLTTFGLPRSSNPSHLVDVNGTLLFLAGTGADGNGRPELWKSDGTAAGTVLIKEIFPVTDGSDRSFFVNVNGTLFLAAYDEENGNELWKNDGTPAGTVLVKDVNPGADSSSPSELVNANGTLFFTAHDEVNGNELWKSDGTTAGTVLVRDINPSASPPFGFVNINGTVFLTASDGSSGAELWKSDGTEVGTVLVEDIRPGHFGSQPAYLVNLNGTLFFTLYNSGMGSQLWKSDGTEAGTALVADINPGTAGSTPRSLGGNYDRPVSVNGALYFAAFDNVHGIQLWKSVPEPVVSERPVLNIARVGNQVVLSWPASFTGFKLETTTDLGSPFNWSNTRDTPTLVGNQFTVTNSLALGGQALSLEAVKRILALVPPHPA